jgi:7-cyano-7-deazaguanine synthase in queuosine biosynthesis
MNKKILQAVSGGFDSTYLLIKNLQNGDNVYPIYIRVSFINSIKQKKEKEKVKSLIRKLKKKFKNLHNLTEAEIAMSPVPNIFSTQPITWILALFKEAKEKQYSIGYDEAHIGYVKGDFVIRHLPDINAIWNLLFTFSNGITAFKIPKLRFPLVKCGKKMIIDKLSQYDKDILASCWTCETPKIIKTGQNSGNFIEARIEACGTCNTCRNLKRIDKAAFDNMKKYKVKKKKKKYRNAFNEYLNGAIKENNIKYIANKYISLKSANRKSINNNVIDEKKMNKIMEVYLIK